MGPMGETSRSVMLSDGEWPTPFPVDINLMAAYIKDFLYPMELNYPFNS